MGGQQAPAAGEEEARAAALLCPDYRPDLGGVGLSGTAAGAAGAHATPCSPTCMPQSGRPLQLGLTPGVNVSWSVTTAVLCCISPLSLVLALVLAAALGAAAVLIASPQDDDPGADAER